MRWTNVQSQETRVVHKSKVNRRCRRPDKSLLARIKPVTGIATHRTLLIHDMDPEGAALEISTLTRLCPVPDYTRPQIPKSLAYPLPRLVRQCLS